MKKNMGSKDKMIRIIVSIIFAVLSYTGIVGGVLAIVLLALAFILLFTSFIGICPLYSLFDIDTHKKKHING